MFLFCHFCSSSLLFLVISLRLIFPPFVKGEAGGFLHRRSNPPWPPFPKEEGSTIFLSHLLALVRNDIYSTPTTFIRLFIVIEYLDRMRIPGLPGDGSLGYCPSHGAARRNASCCFLMSLPSFPPITFSST